MLTADSCAVHGRSLFTEKQPEDGNPTETTYNCPCDYWISRTVVVVWSCRLTMSTDSGVVTNSERQLASVAHAMMRSGVDISDCKEDSSAERSRPPKHGAL